MEYILGNWDWYIAGPLIGLFVPLLLIFRNKLFGISSSFTHLCSIALPESKRGYLNYNFKKDSWKFYFVIGIFLGAYAAVTFLSAGSQAYLPADYFSLEGCIYLFIGGLCVGFGTRYADGCTSGHAITGLSLLNPASLKATVAFFCGGVIYTFVVVYIL
jgi:uncharacterized membrane protein YedE/YeeE